MITQQSHQLVDAVDNAQEALSVHIYAEMDAITRKLQLTEMIFTHFNNHYEVGGDSVDSEELDDLEELFRRWVWDGGFEASWTPEKGWN